MNINDRNKAIQDMVRNLEIERKRFEETQGVTFEQKLMYCELKRPEKGKSGIWSCRNRYKAWKVEMSHRTLDGLKLMIDKKFAETIGNVSKY